MLRAMRRAHRTWLASVAIASLAGTMVAAPSTAADRRGSAPPSDLTIQVDDFSFAPSAPTIARGATVTFDFVGDDTHTATDSSGLELFDSGNVAPGSGPSLSFTYEAAGIYHFVCTPHAGMASRVEVPMRAAPASGGQHTTFTLVWAAAAATGDQVYDVQVKRPGKAWTTWRAGLTARTRSFDPSRTGLFRFRARMRDVALDTWSRWSPASVIRVG